MIPYIVLCCATSMTEFRDSAASGKNHNTVVIRPTTVVLIGIVSCNTKAETTCYGFLPLRAFYERLAHLSNICIRAQYTTPHWRRVPIGFGNVPKAAKNKGNLVSRCGPCRTIYGGIQP